MNESDFLNVYIETISSTLDEYVKKDIMNRAHLTMAKKAHEALLEEIASLKGKIEELTIYDIGINKEKNVSTF